MSKTKIELEYPYNKDWKCGYLVINPENRRTLILWNNSKDRSSTQYARYKLAVHLGRYLKPDEHVDHIDGDKTNDSISNLQILSFVENTRKAHPKSFWELDCPICGKHYSVERSKVNGRSKKLASQNKRCCSRECGYKQTAITLRNKNNKATS